MEIIRNPKPPIVAVEILEIMMETDSSNRLFEIAASFVRYSHQSLFLTGKAGTGKTTFLKYIREHCNKKMAVAAPTGVAAINAGGVTLHSLFQLPFGTYLPDSEPAWGVMSDKFYNKRQLLRNLRLRAPRRELLQSIELLVIDEISMVRADLLDAVDAVLRSVRRRSLEPFGGVQMLFIGDLYQLPPVVLDNEWRRLSETYKSPWFFDAKVLGELPVLPLELKKIYRQSDNDFIRLLNNVRNNECTEEDFQMLYLSYNPTFIPEKDSGFITLTTHNHTANRLNEQALNRLPGKQVEIHARVEKNFPENAYPADATLRLKVGAQIMFIKNDKGNERRYFNGKIGSVKSIDPTLKRIEIVFDDEPESFFIEPETWDNLRYEYDRETDRITEKSVGSFSQYPIRLAWAVTIHKSQGLTFEKAVIDAGRSFATGQVYVALSRLTSLKGLVLHSKINPGNIMTDTLVQKFMDFYFSEEDYLRLLNEAQMNYVVQLLLSTYDWKGLQRACEEHFQSLASRKISDKDETVSEMSKLLDHQSELSDVAEKFKSKLSTLLQKQPYDFDTINKRNAAAVTWFEPALSNDIQLLKNRLTAQNLRSRTKAYKNDVTALLHHFEQKLSALKRSQILTNSLTQKGPLDVAVNQFSAPVSLTTMTHKKKSAQKGDSQKLSLQMYQSGKSISEIAQERSLMESTIAGHLTRFIPTGEVPLSLFLTQEQAERIWAIVADMEAPTSGKLKEIVGEEFSYTQLRAALAAISNQAKTALSDDNP